MQQGNFNDVDSLGKKLSLVLGCPVRWTGHERNVFVCSHDIAFPLHRLKGLDDWTQVKAEHDKVVS